MKTFLIKTFIFLFILFFQVFLLITIGNMIIDNGNYFKIKDDTKYIVLGYSHPAFAYNDSLIDNFENYAQHRESYFYTYFKTKKIIHANEQIKVVFIEFSNTYLSKDAMEDWIWGNASISEHYQRYSVFMNFREIFLLFKKNSNALTNSQLIALKKNWLFILSSNTDYINYLDWGGYYFTKVSKTDSIINNLPNDTVKQYTTEISKINFEYLSKIIDLCNQNGIKVFFIRSPLHKNFAGFALEKQFKEFLKNNYPTIELLDFYNFPLENNEFSDLQHLNYAGASKLSIFFNKLIKTGLLENQNKQEMINSGMDSLKKTK